MRFRSLIQITKARFFFEQFLGFAHIAVEKDAHGQTQIVQQVLGQLADFLLARVRELAALLDLLVFQIQQHALDDVADLLHIDGEADDFRPALAFAFIQFGARDLGHVVLDGRVQIVHRTFQLPHFLGQLGVIGLRHFLQADQHGLDQIGLMQ